MGITIQLSSEDSVEFVPDFQNNRDLAAEGGDAFVVDILPMSGAEYDKLHTAMMGGSKGILWRRFARWRGGAWGSG